MGQKTTGSSSMPMAKPVLFPKLAASAMNVMAMMIKLTIGIRSNTSHHAGFPAILSRMNTLVNRNDTGSARLSGLGKHLPHRSDYQNKNKNCKQDSHYITSLYI